MPTAGTPEPAAATAPTGDETPVYYESGITHRGPWYHGTHRVFKPGDSLVPIDHPDHPEYGHFDWSDEEGNQDQQAHSVYMTPDPEFARGYGPNVYRVDPGEWVYRDARHPGKGFITRKARILGGEHDETPPTRVHADTGGPQHEEGTPHTPGPEPADDVGGGASGGHEGGRFDPHDPDVQGEAAASYLGNAAEVTNKELRDGTMSDDHMEEFILPLDEWIKENADVPAGTVLYRGATGAWVHQLGVGDELHEKGYLSTSTDRGVASGYARNSGAVFEIQSDAKGVDIEKVVYYDDFEEDDDGREYEVLLPRDQKFRVESVTRDGRGRPVIKLVPASSAQAPAEEAPAGEIHGVSSRDGGAVERGTRVNLVNATTGEVWGTGTVGRTEYSPDLEEWVAAVRVDTVNNQNHGHGRVVYAPGEDIDLAGQELDTSNVSDELPPGAEHIVPRQRPPLDDVAQHTFNDYSSGNVDGWTYLVGNEGVNPSGFIVDKDNHEFFVKIEDNSDYGAEAEVDAANLAQELGIAAPSVRQLAPPTSRLQGKAVVAEFAGVEQGWDVDGSINEVFGPIQPELDDFNLADPDDVLRLHIFDIVTENGDRHPNNLMVAVDDSGKRRLLPIDHGMSFGGGPESLDPLTMSHKHPSVLSMGVAARARQLGREKLREEVQKILVEIEEAIAKIHWERPDHAWSVERRTNKLNVRMDELLDSLEHANEADFASMLGDVM